MADNDKADSDDSQIYSLIALDIDGTMIGEDRIVHPDLVGAIDRVQSLGATVSIATGRALAPAARVAREAGVTGPVICFQGAMTFDGSTRSEIRHVRLDEGIAAAAILALTSVVHEVRTVLVADGWWEERTE